MRGFGDGDLGSTSAAVSDVDGVIPLPSADELRAEVQRDADLAARQVGFYTDVVRRLDRADRAVLRAGDPTLGVDAGSDEELEYREG